MQIIAKAIIPLCLATILTACNSFASTAAMATPTTNSTDVMVTALSMVETKVMMAQAAIPTATFPPPTSTPADVLSNGQVSPPPVDKLDYAMTTAMKVYALFPYIDEASLVSGEYSGCRETYDFHNFVNYVIRLPLETVNAAFAKYFAAEKWESTEPVSDVLPAYDYTIPRIIYEAHRITSKDRPGFETLRVILMDDSAGPGLRGDYIQVRAEFTYTETQANVMNPAPSDCNFDKQWLWARLSK